ncbi:MAG: hypothetical protein WC360_04620, partial [Opitutales bacterium]
KNINAITVLKVGTALRAVREACVRQAASNWPTFGNRYNLRKSLAYLRMKFFSLFSGNSADF